MISLMPVINYTCSSISLTKILSMICNFLIMKGVKRTNQSMIMGIENVDAAV